MQFAEEEVVHVSVDVIFDFFAVGTLEVDHLNTRKNTSLMEKF